MDRKFWFLCVEGDYGTIYPIGMYEAEHEAVAALPTGVLEKRGLNGPYWTDEEQIFVIRHRKMSSYEEQIWALAQKLKN